MTKYAPANDEGEKPYVVTQGGWGRSTVKLAYGDTASDAKYRAFGRQGVGEYIIGCRRATLHDEAVFSDRPYAHFSKEEFAAAVAEREEPIRGSNRLEEES